MPSFHLERAFNPEIETSFDFSEPVFDFVKDHRRKVTEKFTDINTIIVEAAINITKHSARGRNGTYERLHGEKYPISVDVELADTFCRMSFSNYSDLDRSVTLNGRASIIRAGGKSFDFYAQLGTAWYTYSDNDPDSNANRGNGLVDIVDVSDELLIQSEMVGRRLFKNTVTSTVYLDEALPEAA